MCTVFQSRTVRHFILLGSSWSTGGITFFECASPRGYGCRCCVCRSEVNIDFLILYFYFEAVGSKDLSLAIQTLWEYVQATVWPFYVGSGELAYTASPSPAEQSPNLRSLFLVCISLCIICVVPIVACGSFGFMCYFKYFYMFFILCVCLPACLCITCVPGTHKGLKYMWIPRNWSYRC